MFTCSPLQSELIFRNTAFQIETGFNLYQYIFKRFKSFCSFIKSLNKFVAKFSEFHVTIYSVYLWIEGAHTRFFNFDTQNDAQILFYDLPRIRISRITC